MTDPVVQVIVLVEDLVAARSRMEGLGLCVAAGGSHPGRGTANLIVPLGQQYVELLAVVDRGEALGSPQGRPVVSALASRGPGLARWSVEASDIGAASQRVGLPIERRSRVLPDGTSIWWQSVGVDEAWAEPWRCAFMAWDDPQRHPARTAALHPNGATGFAQLDVAVPDREREALVEWLGGDVPPGVRVEAGDAGPLALALASPTGPVPITLD